MIFPVSGLRCGQWATLVVLVSLLQQTEQYVMYQLRRLLSSLIASFQWPYSYDSCDVGTLANQSYFGRPNEPAAAHVGGDEVEDGELSFLPGQKLSACTCPGEE